MRNLSEIRLKLAPFGSQLKRLRPGCPLFHLGLSHPDDLALFSEAGSALLEGRYPLDDGTRTIKGNLLITDPMHVLMAAAQNPDERTRWLGQLLWLTDGDAGPDAPHSEPGGVQTSSARIEHRFCLVLGKVVTYRFNAQIVAFLFHVNDLIYHRRKVGQKRLFCHAF